MKIGHLENKAALNPTSTERKAPAASGHAEPSAKVELSSTALIGNDAQDVFDTDKVQRIADAIRDGKFVVNAGAIADKLIANAQELLSGARKS